MTLGNSSLHQDATPKIVIQGWYGNGNLGDEIILECMLSQIREYVPGASFVVVSDDPADTVRRHHVKSIARGGGRIQRLRRLQALADADLFILGGGGLLKQFGSSKVSMLTWLGPLDLAEEMGVPNMTFAVGVSDELSRPAEHAMKVILSKADAVLVRDQESLDILRRIGVSSVKLSADPALLFPELHPSAWEHPTIPARTWVSVFVNHWYVTNSMIPNQKAWERFENEIAKCIDYLIENSNASVRFIPMQVSNPDSDDRAVAREIVKLARNRDSIEVLETEVSGEELLALISESKLVIGMRLHSLILAAALGVPALAIEYQSKVRRFSNSIGASEWVVGITDSASGSMRRLGEQALFGAYPLEKVREKTKVLQGIARESARVAASLIQSPKEKRHRLSRSVKMAAAISKRTVGRRGSRNAGQ